MNDPLQACVRIGIGVMILKDGKVLLGLRTGSHGVGEWAFPGGHLEYMGTSEGCARRETLEKCGVEIQNIRFQLLENLRHYRPKHYVHVGLIADWNRGEPKVLEPEKCRKWEWYDLDNLPSLFRASQMGHRGVQHGQELL